MVRNCSIRLAFAPLFLLALAGCHAAPVAEPESDYVEMRPLIYDYGTVFDCVTEAITEEGLQVKEADRVQGTVESNYVAGVEDRVQGKQAGSRVRARVIKIGPKDFAVRMAATRLERDLMRDNTVGEWRYSGRDPDLLDKLKKRFDKQVDKRYRAAPDRGG